MFNKKVQQEKDFSKGFVYHGPGEEPHSKKPWLFVGLLFTLSLLLVIVTIIQNGIGLAANRFGDVTGFAVDESGTPIQVEISVYGTDLKMISDEYGFFRLNDVPAGDQSVIVAYGRIASEVKVNVKADNVTDVGAVVVQTSLAEELEQN